MCLYIARWGPLIHADKCSDYRAFPKGMIAALHCPSTNIKLTLNERWNPVTSVILFWTIFLRFGVIFGGRAAAAVVLGYQFALLRNKVVSESRKWSHCAGWWACCGALNGSPVDNTKHTAALQTTLPEQTTEIRYHPTITSFDNFKWKLNPLKQTIAA